MMRIVIGKERIDAAGSLAVMNSVVTQMRNFMNSVEKEIAGDKVLVVEVSLRDKGDVEDGIGESFGRDEGSEKGTDGKLQPSCDGAELEGDGLSEDAGEEEEIPQELNLDDETDPLDGAV